ncbi:MAG: glycoside hydrolase family 9 [Pedosphaera sp.]|nr:glycoside hydrolase family 9 [Pedosphaera sp.]
MKFSTQHFLEGRMMESCCHTSPPALSPSHPCSMGRGEGDASLRCLAVGAHIRAGWVFRLLIVVSLFGFAARNATAAAAAEIYLRVNQTGYRTADVKSALAFCLEPITNDFRVTEEESRKVVFEGRPALVEGKWGKFENHVELDFSAVKMPGRYTVSMGKYKSLPFTIGAEAYRGLPDELLGFMREQRCGYNPFLDAVCHPFDGRSLYGPMTNGTYVPLSGGWHDGNDYMKFLLTAGNATAQMLLAYKLEPRGFTNRVNAPGQPGTNGLPDVLDEARWGLEWLLKLHPTPDQLFHQVGDDRDHTGTHLPQNEVADYGWGQNSYRVAYFADGRAQGLRQQRSESTGVANLAGRYAAAMGLAYQIWKDDPRYASFAEQCLQAGLEVYQLGLAHEGAQQGNSYNSSLRYAETTWADDMEWGAAELYHATRKKVYLEDAAHFAGISKGESWMGKEKFGYYQFYPFVNIGHFALSDVADRGLRKELAAYYREGIESCLQLGQKNPYRVGVPFERRSNNLLVGLATQIMLYERMTGDLQYHAFLSAQRDWLLGRNPWGTSMFTAIPAGGIYPHDIYLQTVKLVKHPVRGGLVNGPVSGKIFRAAKDVALTEPDPLALFQDETAVYHDDGDDYVTNEPNMDGTASAVLLWTLSSYEK